MPNGNQKVGANPANISPVQDQAIRLIKEIYESVSDLDINTYKAFMGRNKTIRDNNAFSSASKAAKLKTKLSDWFKVIEAKDNGADVHRSPINSHKLKIVSDSADQFAQYIVDKESK